MRFVLKIASVFLIAFVLIGGKGLEVYKSFCKETQQTQFLLTPNVDPCEHGNAIVKHSCCVEKDNPVPKKQKCCDEKEIRLKLNFPYSIEKTNISFQQALFPVAVPLFSFHSRMVQDQTICQAVFDPPSKPSRKRYLPLLSTWRI